MSNRGSLLVMTETEKVVMDARNSACKSADLIALGMFVLDRAVSQSAEMEYDQSQRSVMTETLKISTDVVQLAFLKISGTVQPHYAVKAFVNILAARA